MLVQVTRGVNCTNILWACMTVFWVASPTYSTYVYYFLKKSIGKKAAIKFFGVIDLRLVFTFLIDSGDSQLISSTFYNKKNFLRILAKKTY